MDKFVEYGNRFPFLIQQFLVWLFPGYRRYHEDRDLRAGYDSLTNVRNEREAKELFFNEVQLLVREHPVSVTAVFLDLDGFKAVNDSCGHDIGDQILKHFAGLLTTTFRSSDIVLRKGGDEFVVVLINTLADLAITNINRLLETIHKDSNLTLECHGKMLIVTASIGIASGQIFSAKNIEEAWTILLINADVAMYTAKKRGKNRYHRNGDTIDFGTPRK